MDVGNGDVAAAKALWLDLDVTLLAPLENAEDCADGNGGIDAEAVSWFQLVAAAHARYIALRDEFARQNGHIV